jgi:disulfide bond formation protein DsbB
MCYGISYDCTIDCINTNLNTTKLGEGVVTGMMPYNGCTITCADGVQWTDSWGATYNAPLEPTGLIPELYRFLTTPEMLVILAIVFIIFLLALFVYFNRVAK